MKLPSGGWKIAGMKGLGAGALLLLTLTLFQCMPMINDISTDLENPPQFEADPALRGGAATPSPYRPGGKRAEIQRQAYPDLQPGRFAEPPGQVFPIVLATARELGWNIVLAEPQRGRLEAVASTRWLRFKDDVVVRLTPDGAGTRVDMRSKSRLGTFDLGANARRIRGFLALLGEAGLTGL